MAEPSTRTVERALALLATICDRGGANLADSATGLRSCAQHGASAAAHAGNHRVRHQGRGRDVPARKSHHPTRRPGAEQRVVDRPRQAGDGEAGGARRASPSTSASKGTAPRRCTSASSRERTRSGTPAGSVERFPSTASAAGHALRGEVPAEGYVVVERGVEADVTAIACPVYSEARIVAALSLVIPSYRLTASETVQYGRLLASATAGVSAQLSRSPKSSLPERQS